MPVSVVVATPADVRVTASQSPPLSE